MKKNNVKKNFNFFSILLRCFKISNTLKEIFYVSTLNDKVIGFCGYVPTKKR